MTKKVHQNILQSLSKIAPYFEEEKIPLFLIHCLLFLICPYFAKMSPDLVKISPDFAKMFLNLAGYVLSQPMSSDSSRYKDSENI